MTLFDESFTGIRSVSVDVGISDVLLHSGSAPDTVRCTIDGWTETFRVDQRRDRLVIVGPPNQRTGDVILEVPDQLNVSISTQSGDVVVNSDLGGAKITTGSGDVAVGKAASMTIKCGSGDIAVTHVSDAADLSTGSGEIVVREAAGPVNAKSGSGDVFIERLVTANLSASSGSGDIHVPSTSGSVDVRSASGAIRIGIADNLPAWLDLNSVNGEIMIDLDPSDRPVEDQRYVTVRCRTASGEITVFRAGE